MIPRTVPLLFAYSVLGLHACAASPGTHPHDMSAAEHQAAAQKEEQVAEEHAERYDAGAAEGQERCTPGKGRVCWYEELNPTAEHQEHARQHRELAAEHRAASKALVDAEARACAGLRDEDRDMSPFAHAGDIASVARLTEEKGTGRAKSPRHVGATIVFHAVPGLTAEWLQRLVDCHLARNAAVGHEMKEMPYCPLVPRAVSAKVRSVGDGFAVDVRADDAATAEEIWKRASGLVPAR